MRPWEKGNLGTAYFGIVWINDDAILKEYSLIRARSSIILTNQIWVIYNLIRPYLIYNLI